ncbi:pyridoxal phosphate-dependent aminotransferase [Geojedonia litorea]|uniref:Pyridoxal phosphate-dependent aminotransferase n=1 Tax=Geojedonia litorea TaxID=1268269 RepID=A0ABV9N226_9FLAO
MELNRRQWLKTTALAGGFTLFNGLTGIQPLTAEERIKFNPRPFSTPVRLSSNENPYGPSERVRTAIKNAFDEGCRYPYSYSDQLAELLAQKHGVDPESIIITGGSTEGLKIAGITFTANGGEIIAAKPTFLAMMQYAEMWGAKINWVPVDEHMGYDLQEIEKRISSDTKMVFLCNPNNPTSTLLPAEQLTDFCASVSKRTVVFSDEAYYDYIEDPNYPSMIDLVKKGENVVVSKTFSKVYGMAGMRIGYLIAPPHLAQQIRRNIVAMSNVYAIEGAKEALLDDEFYRFSLKKNKEAKAIIYNTLDHLELPYIKSHTNFVFFKSGKNINELGSQMLDKGVSIGRAFPPFYDWCRISTGTIEETQFFAQNLIGLY